MNTPAFSAQHQYGLYIHVPFCRRRCSYCDFYFEIKPADENFHHLVEQELRARRHELMSASIHTLYLGGGTPSRLSPKQIAHIIDVARELGLPNSVNTTQNTVPEITIEANPEDLDAAYAEGLAQAGVNRVSLGVQSWDENVLRYLGRAHTAARATDAVRALQQHGITRISADLIIGVPDSKPSRIQEELDVIHSLGIGHISSYMLTVEENTPLIKLIERGKRKNTDDDQTADDYETMQKLAPQMGWRQYEISSFAVAGEESQHNRIYWAKGSYLGIGPGAHSLRLEANTQMQGYSHVLRRHNTALWQEWQKNPAGAGHTVEDLDPYTAFVEAVSFGLRDLAAGINLHDLYRRFIDDTVQFLSEKSSEIALPQAQTPTQIHGRRVYQRVMGVLQIQKERGLTRCSEETAQMRWYLTPEGARFADAVARRILQCT